MLKQIQEEAKTLLFNRVAQFVKNKHYRHFDGLVSEFGFLTIDVGGDNKIYIDPDLKFISLFNTETEESQDYSSPIEVSVLNKFIVDAEIIAKAKNRRPLLEKIFGRQKTYAPDLYVKSEIFIYKSYLTLEIYNRFLNEDGFYKIKVSENVFLVIEKISHYLNGYDGIYSLEVRNQGVIERFYEDQHAQKILDAIKTLLQHPENLKNLAQA